MSASRPTSPDFFPVQPEGLTGQSDTSLWEAVKAAEIHPLLCALALLTNDDALIDPRFSPDVRLDALGPPANFGLSTASLADAQHLAFRHLCAIRDRLSTVSADPSTAMLEKTLEFATGQGHDVPTALIHRELDIPHDQDAPSWHINRIAPNRRFRVAIIGAGMSGILVAYRLQQAGIDYTVFEKNPEIGGTWYQNSYPGCRLDTPNFAYSYAFAQNPLWPSEFSEQRDILAFFKRLSERFDIATRVQLNAEVLGARYQSDDGQWCLRIRDGNGTLTEARFEAVVSAVGQLNLPKIPEILGAAQFAGSAWHTARWNHDVSLKGKRVGVIGTGASAYQVVPTILPDVESLTVFQRNPPWMLPTPRYHETICPAHQLLLTALPHYARWLRFFQVWLTLRGRWDLVRVEQNYRHPVSVSAANDELRAALSRHIEASYADRPELLKTQLPDYPPGAKRMLRDNGVWPAALKNRKVLLETRPISHITTTGIAVGDAIEHPLDVIIYATGFRASEFLAPMEITGLSGKNLHAWWNGEPRAYLGMCIPGFPNFFCMYGPNTNLVVHGSLILFAESAANYIMQCFKLLLEKDKKSLVVTEEAFQSFCNLIDRENQRMAWGASSVSSWYKNDAGRVTQNWPLSISEFFTMTSEPKTEAFVFE